MVSYLSRDQKTLPNPPPIKWPNFQVKPHSHEEHTAMIFELCDQVKSLARTTTGSSESEAKVLTCLEELAEFAHMYARYTAHIMESGKTLATKEDLDELLVHIRGGESNADAEKPSFAGEYSEAQWDDDKYTGNY